LGESVYSRPFLGLPRRARVCSMSGKSLECGARYGGILCTLDVVQPAIPSTPSGSGPSPGRRRANRLTWAGQVLLLAFLYVVAGRLGLEFTHDNDNVTLIWPPTGLSLAALILFGVRLWPGVFLGALLANLMSSLAWHVSFGIAIGNTLEAVVGVTVLVRLAGFQATLQRQRDWVSLILIGVFACTLFSASIGTGTLLFWGELETHEFWQVWLIWWLGDIGGALVVAPALLIGVYGTPSWRSLFGRLESWLALVLLIATSSLAFFGPDLGILGFPLTLCPFPVLTWAGTRLGSRGAATSSLIAIVIAASATGMGSGPFVVGTPTEAMFLLWTYSSLIGITAFALASVANQRSAAEGRYRSMAQERLRSEKQKTLLVERDRLTRELHDGLGGQLVSILSMVERGLAVPSEVAEALRRAIDDIRIAIDSLDPHSTDLATSLGKLRARLEPLLRRNGIRLSWDVEEVPGLDEFSPEATLHLLRIIQEAVTNTLRHADAKNVEIRIAASSDPLRKRLVVTVGDDGCGWVRGTPSGGRGLRNMRSRAKELGAELRIDGANSGMRVELTIPFSGRVE